MSRDRFAEFVRDAILSLPQDMKALLRVVEDPDVDDEGRIAAAGALIHVLAGANAIPGMRGVLALVGHVIVLRLVLVEIGKQNDKTMERLAESAPELLGPLAEHLELTRSYLGKRISILEKAAAGVAKLQHQGRSAKQCAEDDEASAWLYGAVHEAEVEQLELDEDEVARAVKNVDQILPALDSRLSAKP